MPSFRLAEIAERFGLRLHGDGRVLIDGVATLQAGRPGAISFLANRQYHKYLKDTRVSAVVLGEDDVAASPVPALVSTNPYLSYAQIAGLFIDEGVADGGVHPSAIVDPSAHLAEGVSIGANVVIGAGVSIGTETRIGAGSVIEDACSLGERGQIAANVTICRGSVIGDRCRILAGAVIGSRGFGLAPSPDGWVEVPQLGRVLIGDDCEIGANTTIDRGAVEDTVIENGVKLDNLIQVAHNVRIGAHTVIAGCTGIAGSADIGERCLIGGAVAVLGHLSVPAGTRINAFSLVSRSIPSAGNYASGIPVQEADGWNKNVARLRQLSNFVTEMRTNHPKKKSDE